MKFILRTLGVVAAFGELAFLFGYFDADLTSERIALGCTLIVVSLAVGWSALTRLVEDWPRAKPRYNADFVFAQIALSFLMLTSAFFLGGHVSAALARLREPLPSLGQVLGISGGPAQQPATPTSPTENSRTRR